MDDSPNPITTYPEYLPPTPFVPISDMSYVFDPGGLQNFKDITPQGVDTPEMAVLE